MGLETIQVLDKLTSEIKFVFLHPTMVDRIAAMLNYFLKNLVGPQRKSFKVCFLGQPRRSSSVGLAVCELNLFSLQGLNRLAVYVFEHVVRSALECSLSLEDFKLVKC